MLNKLDISIKAPRFKVSLTSWLRSETHAVNASRTSAIAASVLSFCPAESSARYLRAQRQLTDNSPQSDLSKLTQAPLSRVLRLLMA